MLGFLKNLLKKKVEKVKIGEDGLSDWFQQKIKPISELLVEELRISVSDLKHKINRAKALLDELETASLRNPNIPLRVRQIMEGNREAYINRVSLFLIGIRTPVKIEEINGFAESMGSSIDSLAKSTLKEYHVLQEFFADESRSVANGIKDIERAAAKIKSVISNEKLLIIKDIELNIKGLAEKKTQKGLLEKSLADKKKEFEDITNVKKELKAKIASLEKDPKYKELQELMAKRKEALNKLNIKASEILYLFGIIDKAIKKFIRISYLDESILASYLESPISAIYQDKGFRIVDILQKLKGAVIKNMIELDDKKKEKAVKVIDTITREWIIRFFEDYTRLKQEKESFDVDIEQIPIEAKIEAFKKQLSDADDFCRRLDNDIKGIEDNLEAIDLDTTRDYITGKIFELLNIKVEF